jgi:MbtH protein
MSHFRKELDMDEEDRVGTWTVLINDEEQHSLWPSQKPAPAGWRNAGVYGSKQECLDYVEREWKDITPLSVRKALAAGGPVQ